ncbi:activating signal cointegrator 1 complex subunit 2 [Anastrepha ludens]|uniref:activating signal cointegrator 1 complex subunit 2 n=1 Tax=Anastrepha ludens TaxID=28586 RepID=UPI0023B09CD2|nr:activating signal cointegrator 1 complex subunit 2 [Anastrepha ludens]
MTTTISEEFPNPEKKSLDQLVFRLSAEDGLAPRFIPALHKHWAPRENFTIYVGLLTQYGRAKSGVELDEWQYNSNCFCNDMNFLLNCHHHEFWSYMVFQKTALAAVVSFLQRSTPFYLNVWTQLVSQQTIIDLYEQILQLVLRIVCRLITNRESDEAWLTIEHQRELIYKNFLISVPMLFDLLMAVGDADAQNTAVLRRIFDSILRIEPNYKKDLLAASAFFRTAFRSIQTQAENEGFEGAGGGDLDENAETPYDDVALYTLDCAYSLSVLLEVCPEVQSMCTEIKLGQSIAQFYDNTIPFLYKNIFLINEAASSLGWLNLARLQYLKAFRSITCSFIEAVMANPATSITMAEQFIGLLTECLSEQIFVNDYGRLYPVELDVDILKQACKELDDYKASFIVQGYKQESKPTGKKINSRTNKAQNSGKSHKKNSPANSNSNVTTATNLSNERDIDLEVTSVLDVLPHLGTGFVRRVLSRYDNSEEAITAILEANLPPDLVNADQSEIYIPPDPQDKTYQQTGVKHFNVYDGDQYDVMTQDNPKCIIKQGKGMPNAPKNAAQLLDDKSDLAQIKSRYQAYSLVSEGESSNDEYEDEYDDSYEALLESETRVVKSKQFKAGLANVEDFSDDESEDDDAATDDKTKSETQSGHNKQLNFCENPEDVRARYEARRQAKWGNRNQGGATDYNNKARHVVGAPKGQGQDKDTLRNRDKKEKNKSMRANHNRKAGASFKRSRGMMG